MCPSPLEKYQETGSENLNIVDQSTQNKLLVLTKPQYLPDLQKRQDDLFSKLDEKAK